MPIMRMLSAALFLCVSAAAQDQPVTEWIRTNAIRLQTPVAGHGFADMQPLKKVIGDARIVSLGEATHGTREFFQLKHRMLEFLATEMGFSIFSIEANMPEAYKLNDYVLNGTGDPVKLIKGMYFWTWDTQEVLDMVLWMREFNKSGKGRVEFTGFDMQTPAVAAGIARDFVAKADPDYLADYTKAQTMSASATTSTAGQGFGVATATFPLKDAAGKRVRYSGYIKTQGVTTGFAGLWWRVDGAKKDEGPPSVLAFDNMQNRGVTGTTDWKQYSIELPVAADAANINFGVILPGNGTAWFDSLTVELDGKPYTTDQVDLGFESLKGFYAGGNGYRATLDDEVVHSGKHSLRLSSVGMPKPDPNAVDAKVAAATWKQVIEHMESSRAAYAKKEAPARDIEWAIQNARVVLQCMQMRANEVSRDASMAANVKWILDQNPKAKIVLWAHNGHVTRRGSYASMGAALAKTYGPQMVVFGFAFHQGSFQAISQEKRILKDFTVPPAPPDSFDATLASAGIPLLALDVRNATGPAAAWFGAAHDSRMIGALYYEDQPFALMQPLKAPESYDAILFVEKTSAARKNLGISFANAAATAPAGAREYTDPEYGVRFTVPPAWKIGQAMHWGNRESTVVLERAEAAAPVSLYYRPVEGEPQTAEERQRVLTSALDGKVAQRVREGLTDYQAPAGDCRSKTVGGSPARSCVARFTQDGKDMMEYLTWIEGERVHGLVFGRVPAKEFEVYRQRVDELTDILGVR